MKLWNYQSEAAQHIISHPEAGLFLDMGLGKTAITLTAINELMYDWFDVKKVLVIAPLRVAKVTWPTEIEKWTPDLTYSIITGSAAEREEALKVDADVYITNREQVVWLVNHYQKNWPFDMVVIDELSSFKSSASQRFRALKKVRKYVKRFVGLTGTPAPNNLLDLWPEVYLLDEGQRLGKSITQFRSNYFIPGRRNQHVIYEWLPTPTAEKEIYSRIQDICISMKAKDYLDMPERIDIPIKVELPEEAKKIIRELKKNYIAEIKGDVLTADTVAVLFNQLLQIANGAVYTDNPKYDVVHEAKVDALEELQEASAGEPMLVFYWFKHDLERLKKRFPEARELQTEDDIRDWNDHKIKMAFAHPASTGHGLNLQYGGSIIVWFSLTWSLELYQQANARLLRQGQTKPVRIYHLIAQGTIDAKVMQALRDKDVRQQRLIDAVRKELDVSGN